MKSKKLKNFVLPAALVAGGITAGSLFVPLGLASAQETDADSSTATDQPEADSENGRRGKGGNRLATSEPVADVLGLTQDELKARRGEGASLSQIADDSGVSLVDLKSVIAAGINERIDSAVSEGRIDATKEAEKRDAVDEKVDKIVEATPGDRQGKGDGEGKEAKQGQRFEGVAELLGLTTEEIRAGLSEGKSLVDIAAEQGVAEDDLVAVLLEDVLAKINEAVENGDLDATQAAEKTESAEERIRAFVNGEESERGEGQEGHGRRGGSDRSGTTETSNDQSGNA